MLVSLSPDRLPAALVPFFVLQYPTNAPRHPDSFPDSNYYNVGKLDICLVITLVAIMAILRDAFRLGVFESFARWKLTRDLERRQKAREIKKSLSDGNGSLSNVNGHISYESTHLANGALTNGHAHANGNSKPYSNGRALANGNSKIPHTPKELRHLNRSVLRFAEQGWSVVYYTLQWCYGLVGPRLFSCGTNLSHLPVVYSQKPSDACA
jgi:acyl-CoA-dependent ceramide synthase